MTSAAIAEVLLRNMNKRYHVHIGTSVRDGHRYYAVAVTDPVLHTSVVYGWGQNLPKLIDDVDWRL